MVDLNKMDIEPTQNFLLADGGGDYDQLDADFDSDSEDPNVFKVRNALSPPAAKTFSTRELHSLIHQGTIDLNPSYQRDVVWPESKQMGLIDSLFRNFYIPPIVFAVQRDDDNEEVRVCVDGKQRLTSIQKFFDGQIPFRDHTTKKKFWYTMAEKFQGQRTEVPEIWKERFSGKQITCVEYYGIPSGMERELFQRVQLGMTLTAAEKLQAVSSPWAEWILELETQHVALEGGLSQVLQWDTRRGRDFQNLAHLVYCCDGLPDHKNLPSAQKVEAWLSRVDNPPTQFKQHIEQVLRDLWKIASNEDLNSGFKKIPQRLAPVEFLFIGVLLYMLRGESLSDRATAIYNLRLAVRQEFKDIRNNSSVGKVMWRFVEDLQSDPNIRPGVQGSESKVAKRKRKMNDEEVEYRPQPVRSFGKTPKTRSSRKDG